MRPGDVVAVYKDQFFPADLLLLTGENEEGICYIETMNLDGETNLKIKKCLDQTKALDRSNVGGAARRCRGPPRAGAGRAARRQRAGREQRAGSSAQAAARRQQRAGSSAHRQQRAGSSAQGAARRQQPQKPGPPRAGAQGRLPAQPARLIAQSSAAG